MATVVSKIGEVAVQQDPPATAEGFGHAVRTAIKAGKLGEVQSLLGQWRSDSSISGPSPEDINYLVPRAAENNGEPEILEYLLSQGGEIGTHTIGRTTSPEIFQIFVHHGWKADNRVLHTHVSHPNLISFFLSHGADAKIPTAGGGNPLIPAAHHAPLESVKLLLSRGAPLGSGSAALNAAAQGNAPDRIPVMAYLLEHGADINGLVDDITGPSEARRAGRKGTPLHTAAKWGNEEAMAWLLEHGANPEAKNQAGETPAEWGKRFEKDGPEWIVRVRRAINRKNTLKREKEEKESQKKVQESNAGAADTDFNWVTL